MSLSKYSGSQSSLSTIDESSTEIKVKVDRNVLDLMLNGGNHSLESAETFFARVANESGAAIAFPRREKLQHWGRRDPELRMFGTEHQVRIAKGLILAAIGPYKCRVTIKIDISFGDHSHIIGKGGKRIQSIMNSTETHIHFPDCNRIDSEVKSNQVTIAGSALHNVEEARLMVRQHLPLTISFNAEINSSNIDRMNPNHPNLLFFQRRYGVIVIFKVTDVNAIDSPLVTVMVRGTRLQFDDLREAVRSVFTHITWSSIGWNALICTIYLDISPQHHAFVMGRGNCNIKAINEHTGAVVSFPDVNVSASANPDNGTVTIRGRGIDSAYLAWVELLGYLPVNMIFALSPDQDINTKIIQSLITEYEIAIVIRQKLETGGKLLVVKTQERQSQILFEVRRRILGITEEMPSIDSMTFGAKPANNLFTLSNSALNFLNYETEVLRAFRSDF